MEKMNKKSNKSVLGTNIKFFTKTSVLLLLVFAIQACNDTFLEQVNPNALTTASFWKNVSDLDKGLVSVYSVLKDKDILGILDDSKRTDIACHGGWRSGNGNSPDDMYYQTFTGNTSYVINKWNALYLGVFRANQVIEAYERLKPTLVTTTSMQQGLYIVAQARALRGYFYYVLNTSYNNGSVPLVTSIPKDFAEFQKAFSTSEKVKEFYRADLAFGKENLPKTYAEWQAVGSNNLGRITGGACESLLGYSYLMENNFGMAETYFKNVIDNYNYSLTTDLAKCVTGIAEFNKESIFEVNYSTNINLQSPGEETVNQEITHALFNANIQPSSWLTLKFRADKVDPIDPANINVGAKIIDKKTGLVTGTENRLRIYSLRMATSLGSVDDQDALMYGVGNGEYGNNTNAAPYARNRHNVFKKFTHWNTIGGGVGEDRGTVMNNKSDINISVIRLADVYLSYAECMLAKGDLSESLRYINRVRKRSHLILLGKSTSAGAEYANAQTTYMDDIDMDPTNGIQAVTTTNLMEHLRFTEKPLELCLEGDRAADLRRWGVFKQELVKLASRKYDYWNFPANYNGVHGERFKCFLTLTGQKPTTYVVPANKVTFLQAGAQDCTFGAINFNESLHSYLPIPQTEIDSNLNWDSIKD